MVWNHEILWSSIYWECHHPNWLSYFSEELKPPTSIYLWSKRDMTWWCFSCILFCYIYIYILMNWKKTHVWSKPWSLPLWPPCSGWYFGAVTVKWYHCSNARFEDWGLTIDFHLQQTARLADATPSKATLYRGDTLFNHLEVCCFLSFDLQSFATHGGIMACQKLRLAPGIEVHYGGSIMAQWRIRKVTLAGYQNN